MNPFNLFNRRFRSPERDRNTDHLRARNVQAALENALSEIEREKHGLNRRLEEARLSAAATVGSGAFDYLERDPSEEEYLLKAESQMKRASARLKELQNQSGAFEEALATLKNKIDLVNSGNAA